MSPDSMNVEENRLRTFESWPANVAVGAQRVAKAGFFSTGQGLEVQCFCCGGKISEWNYGDQVIARHRTLDPHCPFVNKPAESGNVPMFAGGTPPPSMRSSEPNGERPSRSNSTVGNIGTWDQGMMYRSEAARLQSFQSWPIPFTVAPERLARAGFYYLQQGDRVQCAFCSGVVCHWEAGDDPSVEHQRHFPNCPLNLNLPIGNIPLGQSVGRVQQYPNDHNNVTVGVVRPFSASDRNVVHGVMKERYMNELGIQTHHGPRHPEYTTVESRLRTFTNWLPDMSQTPQQLAQAGFYHIGMNDQVRCFHCDGVLRHWEPGDDPWIEHARWFSLCGYVRLVKGVEFVQQSLTQHPPILPTSGEVEDNKRETVSGHPKVCDVTEEQLQGLMCSGPASVALHVGLDASWIKLALRHKMEQTGVPFTTPDVLIEAVLYTQMNEETAGTASSSTNSREARPIQSADTVSEEEWQQPMPQRKPPLNNLCSMQVLSNKQEVLLTDEASTESVLQLPCADDGSNKAKADDGVAFSLEEEVRRLKEAHLCKICMDEEVGVVFLPCGHLVTCVTCALSLHDCPMCRQLIKATVRTFLS